ncbi:MAG TPA: Uma2 family endonuclease [Gammaproteobacteria bacterium]|nr:Uma2 family endonuclease [Gammaproteobacteria bacterium]
MSAKPLKKNATYDDLCEVPENFVAEMFDGDLYASPRPALPRVHAGSVLGYQLGTFHHNGPDGWVILDEPELHFGSDVLVPDLAGWRRTRMPRIPAEAYVTLAPDWVCEVLSISTEPLDRGKKLRIYAREGVAHAWLVDPLARTLEVPCLREGRWAQLGRYEGEARVRAVPFDAIELDLGALWI